MAGRDPVRTCVGCRQRARQQELVRVVFAAPSLALDLRRRQPGRGAWLHPVPACLDLALRRRAFERALRRTGPLEPSTLRDQLAGLGADRVGGAPPGGPDSILVDEPD